MQHRIPLIALLALLIASTAPAAEWFKLPEAEFEMRQVVTVTNPADVDHPAAVAELKVADLDKRMFGSLVVADEKGQMAPYQVDKGVLKIVTPLKAKESKTFHVYCSNELLKRPAVPAKTGADIREAWRSFENNRMAFRIEIGPGAKTTGMAIDIFGKTEKGNGAILKEIYATKDYHTLSDWGVDVMKVSQGPGLGGLYLFLGDKLGRTSAASTTFEVVYDGPVQTLVRASAPVEIGDKKFVLTRDMKLTADDRSIADYVTIKGDPKDLEGLTVGVGLRNLPEGKFVDKHAEGYAYVAGNANEPGAKKLGLGAAFNTAAPFVRIQNNADSVNGGQILVFKPIVEKETARGNGRLLAYWDGDGQIKSVEEFEKTLAQYAKLEANPIKVELAKEAEEHP